MNQCINIAGCTNAVGPVSSSRDVLHEFLQSLRHLNVDLHQKILVQTTRCTGVKKKLKTLFKKKKKKKKKKIYIFIYIYVNTLLFYSSERRITAQQWHKQTKKVLIRLQDLNIFSG